ATEGDGREIDPARDAEAGDDAAESAGAVDPERAAGVGEADRAAIDAAALEVDRAAAKRCAVQRAARIDDLIAAGGDGGVCRAAAGEHVVGAAVGDDGPRGLAQYVLRAVAADDVAAGGAARL